LTAEILSQVDAGTISPSAAADLARCDDPAEQLEFAHRLNAALRASLADASAEAADV
jgi:hypothetical protein